MAFQSGSLQGLGRCLCIIHDVVPLHLCNTAQVSLSYNTSIKHMSRSSHDRTATLHFISLFNAVFNRTFSKVPKWLWHIVIMIHTAIIYLAFWHVSGIQRWFEEVEVAWGDPRGICGQTCIATSRSLKKTIFHLDQDYRHVCVSQHKYLQLFYCIILKVQ